MVITRHNNWNDNNKIHKYQVKVTSFDEIQNFHENKAASANEPKYAEQVFK